MTMTSLPIVALDVATAREALAIAESLGETCGFFKVGSELFTSEGPAVVRALQDEFNADVFLDLKFHDIPNTVGGAVRRACDLGVRLTTVHASGGVAMLRAAQEAASPHCGVLGVTVLTSFEEGGLARAWGRQSVRIEEEVLRLAADSAAAGLHGLVCSGAEATLVAHAYPELALLVPGIRLPGGDAHDQRRVVTPAGAQVAGARYIVVGRAVTAATDRSGAMRKVLDELAAGAAGVEERGR